MIRDIGRALVASDICIYIFYLLLRGLLFIFYFDILCYKAN